MIFAPVAQNRVRRLRLAPKAWKHERRTPCAVPALFQRVCKAVCIGVLKNGYFRSCLNISGVFGCFGDICVLLFRYPDVFCTPREGIASYRHCSKRHCSGFPPRGVQIYITVCVCLLEPSSSTVLPYYPEVFGISRGYRRLLSSFKGYCGAFPTDVKCALPSLGVLLRSLGSIFCISLSRYM